MRKMQFYEPVSLKSDTDPDGHDVDCVEQALVFLRTWPASRRGPVYQAAYNACTAAKEGYLTAEEARKSLSGFARITGILHKADSQPIAHKTAFQSRRFAH